MHTIYSISHLYARGSISEDALHKIKLVRNIAKNSLVEAKTALEIAISQRQYIRISSEIDGVVVNRHLRKGDLVTPGKPILTIESN